MTRTDPRSSAGALRRLFGPLAMALTFYLLVADSAGPDEPGGPLDGGVTSDAGVSCPHAELSVSFEASGTCGATSEVDAFFVDGSCGAIELEGHEAAGLPGSGTLRLATQAALDTLFFDLEGPVGAHQRRCATSSITAGGRVFACHDDGQPEPTCEMTLVRLTR